MVMFSKEFSSSRLLEIGEISPSYLYWSDSSELIQFSGVRESFIKPEVALFLDKKALHRVFL